MIKFLIKGILRDKSRSLLPIIIISAGVALTVMLSGYMRGMIGDMVDQNARFDTGHVKVMSKAYAENKDQLPNDLALLDVEELMDSLRIEFPEMQWVKRIRFGGLMDVPDENGETKGQGPVSGMAVELFSKESNEVARLNIEQALQSGTIPQKPGEVIIAHGFAEKLQIKIGEDVTFFGSTMNGSMTFKNFIVSGTIRYGNPALDKGAMIVDISDAQKMLDMYDGAGEILGYFQNEVYQDKEAGEISKAFNAKYKNSTDEFAPIMFALKDQNNLADYLDYVDVFSNIFVAIFILAMSVVLWNTGLIGGLRRYKEFGIRLALGEAKGHIYRSLIYEATVIGFIGSVVGTFIGLGVSYYLQEVGIDISSMLENSTLLMPSVMRSKITSSLFYIGFIPGLFAMVLGNMLSGIGIYKRSTASLFKDLEV